MNYTSLYNSYRERSGEQQSNLNQFVAAGLLHIIGHYFTKWSNHFVLTINCNNERTCLFYNDEFVRVFAVWTEWPIQIVNLRNSNNMRIEGIRRYNMILIDSYDTFLEADLSSYTSHNDYNELYYIFLQQRDELLPGEMKDIFEYCWKHYLINCVIQIQNRKGEILLYSYFPFTAKHCNTVEVLLINQFNGTSLIHQELFPKKLKNLHGCPLDVALWHVPPYLFLSNSSKGELEVTKGFEGRLLLELSHQLNFTINIKIIKNYGYTGYVKNTGNLTGALKMLYDREADLSIGSFRQSSDRSEVATSTINYYQTTISFAAVGDIYFLTSVETLLYPFAHTLWILLICVVFLAIVMASIIKRIYIKQFPKNNGSMDIILMLMGMPAIYQPKKICTRIFNVSWMIFALLIRTTYQALLFHMIRTHITFDVPQTLEEMSERGYTIIINRQASAVLSNVPTLTAIKMMALNSSSEFSAIEFLDSLSLKEADNNVAVMPLDFIHYYIHDKNRAGVFKIMPFHVMLFKVCIYLTKHSYLIEQFDEMLSWVQGSGLIDCWSKQVLGSYKNKSKEPADHPFGLAQLKMAFLSLIYCHAMATLVFIAELLYKKLRGSKRLIKK